MVRQLHQARAVHAAEVDVRIPVGPAGVVQMATAGEYQPPSVRRYGRGGEGDVQVGNDAFLDAGGEVDLPDFAPPFRIHPRAKGGIPVKHAGVETGRVAGEEIVLDVVTPEAESAGLLAGEENLRHVRHIDGGVILAAAGDLPADETLGSVSLENRVLSSSLVIPPDEVRKALGLADGEEVFYLNTHFRVVIDWNDPYVRESLDHPVRYAQIERKMFPSGWRYYVVLYLEGDAPVRHTSTDAVAGLDPGVSTAAAVFDEACILEELAPDCKGYNRKITRLSRQIERSVRMYNPDNYDEDGRVRKGRHRWKITGTCRRRKRLLKTVFRQKAAYTKQSHEELADRLVERANVFITEEMDFRALQKRSKRPPERQDSTSVIVKTDGTRQSVRKFKKKKRFGSSIRDRAPAMFLAILKRKCLLQGGDVITADTKVVRASQYDHVTDSYKKVPMSCRIKTVGGHRVQRDLYSGFLLKHVSKDNRTIDRAGCNLGFEAFLQSQEQCINDIRASGAGYPACFGF